MHGGNYPTEEQGFSALIERSTLPHIPDQWERLHGEEPRDSWGNLYLYRFPGSKNPNEPEIISLGIDGVISEDDMSSQD